MKQVTVLLVGVGGYGANIVRSVFELEKDRNIKIAGAVDCNFDASPVGSELKERGVPCYSTMEEFYENHTADLAILTTPIYLHESQSICAMQHGSDCLCEKPVAATVEQAENMQKAAEKYNKKLHIGFQLAYMQDVQKLKKELTEGKFGKVLSASAIICWPRNKDYYSQRKGAGKIKCDGHYCFDSIAMNASAHYIHILFYLLGEKEGTSAFPEKAEVILCRSNNIETFDTEMIKFSCGSIPVSICATHCAKRTINPRLKIICEKAVIEINDYDEDALICVKYDDLSEEKYEKSPYGIFEKIVYACDCVRNGKEPICDVNAAVPHVKCVNVLTMHTPVYTNIETYEENGTIIIDGIETLFETSFSKGVMPWELTDCFGKPNTVYFKDSEGRGE